MAHKKQFENRICRKNFVKFNKNGGMSEKIILSSTGSLI